MGDIDVAPAPAAHCPLHKNRIPLTPLPSTRSRSCFHFTPARYPPALERCDAGTRSFAAFFITTGICDDNCNISVPLKHYACRLSGRRSSIIQLQRLVWTDAVTALQPL